MNKGQTQDSTNINLVEAHKKRKRPLWRRGMRLLFRTVVFFILFFLLLRLLIGLPFVQNKLVNWGTNYFSKELNTTVNIGYVNIGFWKKLVLDDFYVEDQNQDTLFFAKSLVVDFNAVALLQQNVAIEDITLTHVRFNLRHPGGDGVQNTVFLNDYFSKGEKKPAKAPPNWLLSIKNIYLNDLQFHNIHRRKGEEFRIHLPRGAISVANVKLKEQLFEIISAKFDDPYAIYLANHRRIPGTPKPPQSLTEIVDDLVESVDTSTGWLVKLHQLNINNAYFQVDNHIRAERTDGELDVDHLKFHDMNLEVKDFVLARDTANFNLRYLKFREGKGFQLKKLSASESRISRSNMEFYDLELITPDSYLSDSLRFTYPHISDWADFVNTVRMDIRLHGSTVAIKDILVWAPILKRNKFFNRNQEEEILIDGRIYDRVNQLKGKNLSLTLANNSYVEGKFAFLNLMDGEEAALNATIDIAKTNMKNFALLFPFINVSEQFHRLGNLTFSGSFGGFLNDFVADGNLRTDLGTAKTSLRMVLSGPKGGAYAGDLALKNFDLGTWIGNDDFGKISFSANVDGSGFEIDNVTIDTVIGKVSSFTFKDYTYKDIGIAGRFDKRLFAGNLIADDDNIALNFKGTVNFNDSLPKFDLHTNIRKLDLRPLNLLDKDYVLNGGIELKFEGDNPSNIAGYGVVRNFELVSEGEKYNIDSLRIESHYRPLVGERTYLVNSDLMNGELISNFDMVRTKDLMLRFFANNYPAFAERFHVAKYISTDSLDNILANANKNEFFKFNLNVKETRNLLSLIDTNIYEIKKLDVKGRFDSEFERFIFNADLPFAQLGDVKIKNINVSLNAEQNQCTMFAKDIETVVGDSLFIPNITINNELHGDTLDFSIDGGKIGGDILNTLRLRGSFFTYKEFFQVTLASTSLNIYNKEWDILGDNYIRFNDKVLRTQNVHFRSSNGEEALSINSLRNKDRGVMIDIENISLDWMDDFVTMKQFDFDGNFFANIKIGDIFQTKDFEGTARIENFLINERNWGTLKFRKLKLSSLKSPLQAMVELRTKDNALLSVTGRYTLPSAKTFTKPAHFFSGRIDTRRFPVDIAEYFLGGSISNTTGVFNTNILVNGTPEKPNLKGSIRVEDASTTVDYLQTRYFIDEALIDVRQDGFYLGGREIQEITGQRYTGTVIRDENGNTGFGYGGILHDYLRNLRFDITMDAEDFLVLNTEKKDNDLFYGRVIGDIHMEVDGELDRPDLKISGKSGNNSKVILPLLYERKASEVNFIQFEKRDSLGNIVVNDVEKARRIRAPIGVSVEMDLDITPQAEILMIFNEQTGDIIRGKGKGNLKINLERGKDMEMFGTYAIEEGEYLFTYQNLINKPFAVKQGGTIKWDGDPYTAVIDLDAFYKNLNIPSYNFILEYLRTDEEKTLARKTTKVDLLMNLKGDLFKPDIIFDLDFPSIDQRIKSYADAKLRIVKSDKNELNRQVFGLIILGNFIPYDQGFSNGFVSSTINNTLTEMLSNQLSVYLTDLLSEVVDGQGFISSIDFDVNYRQHQFSNSIDNTNSALLQSGSEFQSGLTTGLLNDKLILNIEGNVGTGSVSSVNASGTYIAGDFEIEYILTDDGRIRVRAYSSSEPAITGGNRWKYGGGLSYRREFDSFKEFIDGMVNTTKKKKKKKDKTTSSDVGN